MRVVLLTAHTEQGDVQHRHVARHMLEQFGDDLVRIIVATGVRKPLGQRLRTWWKRYSAAQIVSRIAVRLRRRLSESDEQRRAAIERVLFPGGDDGRMPGGGRVHHVASHNSDECRHLLERLQADVVLVYGTLIIGAKTIAACRRPINLHTGWSPIYRGSDTMFWALHNGEPELAGVTVHRLALAVDAGEILARGRPRIEPGDDEATIFAKGVKLGAELLGAAARREFVCSTNPLVQDLASGREYRSVERTLRAERRLRRRLDGGLLQEGVAEWREEF